MIVDETLLRKANAHEIFLAKHCFEQFTKYISGVPQIFSENIENTVVCILENKLEYLPPDASSVSVKTKILAYSYYADFIRHLYSFYECVLSLKNNNLISDTKTNNPSIKQKHEIMDMILTEEVRKLLSQKVEAIQQGYAKNWENNLGVYTVSVPQEFGEHFRLARNIASHVKEERLEIGKPYSLSNFFNNYHFFVYMLYSSNEWLWLPELKSDSAFLGEISQFYLKTTENLRKIAPC